MENWLSFIKPNLFHISDIAIIKLSLTACKSHTTILSLVLYQRSFDTTHAQMIFDTIHATIINISTHKFSIFEKRDGKSIFAHTKIKNNGIKNQYQKLSSFFCTRGVFDISSVTIIQAKKAHKIAWNPSTSESAAKTNISANENLTSISNLVLSLRYFLIIHLILNFSIINGIPNNDRIAISE